MGKKESKPYGYIYVATNRVNGKVYVGQTYTSQWGENKIPIEERWKGEIGVAYSKKRNENKLRYIENAIIKYGADNFDLKEVDTANNAEELNTKERKWIKDLDAMNPEKGYNMTEGGEGGKLSPELKEYLSKVGTEKWQNDSDYYERQTQERRERAKNPEWIEKMTNVNQEIARNPEYIKNMSEAISKKWDDQQYQENVSKGATDKWQEVKHRGRQFTAKREGKREIPDKGEFLKDIQDMKKKDINSKYDMDGKSINKRIEGMLGDHGIKNFSQAKKFLENKNLDDVVKDIEEKQDEQSQKFGVKKEISNKREFLEDIQNLTSKEIEQKYEMNRSTATKRIREMLGDKGVKNFTDTKEYLKDKDLDDVVKDINERTGDQTQQFEGKSIIENKREFLEDIQNLQKNEIDHKYGMDAKTINNKIRGMLGMHGVKNYTDAREFLKDKDLNEVVKNIEERESEEQGESEETIDNSEKSEVKTREDKPGENISDSEKINEDSSDNGDSREEDVEKDDDNQEEKTEGLEEKPLEVASRENESVSDDTQSPEFGKESPGTRGENSSDPGFRNRKLENGVNYRHFIDDKREFLNDIKSGMTELDITKKYSISNSTLNLIIQDMLGENGPRTSTSLFYHLQNREIDDVLNDIKKREEKERGEGMYNSNLEKTSPEGDSSAAISGSQKNVSSYDYTGIDQTHTDKGEDFKGIEEDGDDSDKDYNRLDDIVPERGSDFDGIDNPQEKEDKDYDNIVEEHPEVGGESGGRP